MDEIKKKLDSALSELKDVHEIVNKELTLVDRELLDKVTRAEFLQLADKTLEIAEGVQKLEAALLGTPVNGFKNMPEALHAVIKATESMRDRKGFLAALERLRVHNKLLYKAVMAVIYIAIGGFILIEVNSILHPFGYGVDFRSSAREQRVILLQDSTNAK